MIEQLRSVAGRDVSRETYEQLQQFAELIRVENERQNLIASNSLRDIWNRHILDGAQLLALAEIQGNWCDIGSGPGLPGLVIAILDESPMTLIEPRRLRADFLRVAVGRLGLANVTVEDRKVERVQGKFDFITARAVAR